MRNSDPGWLPPECRMARVQFDTEFDWIDLEVAYAFGPAQRPAQPGTQAAGEGRGRGGDSAGGGGAHREGGGAHGPVRDRPGPAGRHAARHRPAGQPHHRHRQPVGAGAGAPAGRAGRGHALPVRPAQHDQAGRAHPRVRLHLGPGAGRHLVHLAAAADGTRPGRGGGPGRGAQRPGVAAELAARLRHRRHRPGQGGRGPGGLERGGRDARRGRAPRWCWPTGPWSSAGSWSRSTR